MLKDRFSVAIIPLFLLLVNPLWAQSKPRARDLGVPFDGVPGPANAITDVKVWKWATPHLFLERGLLKSESAPCAPE
jgi:hypothetical protein